MRRRLLVSAAAGVTATAGLFTALSTGAVDSTLTSVGLPRIAPPASAAQSLQPFDDCEQLLDWYVRTALPEVTAWGLGGPPVLAYRAATVEEDSTEAVGNGPTGTNLQEAGVDEPDLAKTNGEIVVRVDGRDVVVTDVSGDDPVELSRVTLPRGAWSPELLLVGDTVVVFSGGVGGGIVPVFDARIVPGGYASQGRTNLWTIDVSDPADPVLGERQTMTGSLVSARQYDRTVRLVISTPTPDIDFVYPGRNRTVREARQENKSLVRTSGIEDWLPSVRTSGGIEPLLECADVWHPEENAGVGTLSVVTFDASDPTDRSSTAVTAAGDLVYSSTDRLYIATSPSGWGWGWIGVRDRGDTPTTDVHVFGVAEDSTTYLTSGEVEGTVKDRWSFSEHDGYLRVATALGRDSWSPRENAVVVLAETATGLEQVGRVGGMGEREQIRSVRWFGDLAILVTFRQVDPLYTVDLSDPTDPEVLGELKIRGFSSYLHPVGDDLLLGLGTDATMRGRTRGAQVSLFDVSDLADPQRLDVSTLERSTELAAGFESRAFTYLPDEQLAVTPLTDWRTGSRLAVISLSDGGFDVSLTGRYAAAWRASELRVLPLEGRTVAVATPVGVEVVTL